jgi:hypothetical protein
MFCVTYTPLLSFEISTSAIVKWFSGQGRTVVWWADVLASALHILKVEQYREDLWAEMHCLPLLRVEMYRFRNRVSSVSYKEGGHVTEGK